MFFFDPIYFVFVAPGFLLAALATILTKSTFAKHSKLIHLTFLIPLFCDLRLRFSCRTVSFLLQLLIRRDLILVITPAQNT